MNLDSKFLKSSSIALAFGLPFVLGLVIFPKPDNEEREVPIHFDLGVVRQGDVVIRKLEFPLAVKRVVTEVSSSCSCISVEVPENEPSSAVVIKFDSTGLLGNAQGKFLAKLNTGELVEVLYHGYVLPASGLIIRPSSLEMISVMGVSQKRKVIVEGLDGLVTNLVVAGGDDYMDVQKGDVSKVSGEISKIEFALTQTKHIAIGSTAISFRAGDSSVELPVRFLRPSTPNIDCGFWVIVRRQNESLYSKVFQLEVSADVQVSVVTEGIGSSYEEVGHRDGIRLLKVTLQLGDREFDSGTILFASESGAEIASCDWFACHGAEKE